MKVLYTLGKIVLVVAIVFQGYNELLDKKQLDSFSKDWARVSGLLPVGLAGMAREIHYGLAVLKLSASLLIFSENTLWV